MEYITASKLTEFKISGLPESDRRLREKAKRENWRSRQRVGRGGGVEYEIAALPALIREAVEKKLAAEILAQQPDLPNMQTVSGSLKKSPTQPRTQLALSLSDVQGLDDKRELIANARMSIVAEILHTARIFKMSQQAAASYFLERLELGKLDTFWIQQVQTANARRTEAVVEMRTLMDWISKYKKAQTPSERLFLLAPKPTKLKKSFLEYVWLPKFAQFHCVAQAPPLAHSYEKFADWWVNNMPINELPNIHMVRRVWKMLPPQMQERGRKTGQAYQSLLAQSKRDWDCLEPNDVWIGDGHSFKAKVAHPKHGQPYVPEITVVIDGCTRKIVGFSVSLAESTKAVCDALRIGMKYHPVPRIYYSDNGAGQTGKLIDHPITGLCARLGIHHETGRPGNPQGRGVIEGVWDITLIKQARNYATFTGNSMDKSTQHTVQRKLDSAMKAEAKGTELTPVQQKYRAMLPSFAQFMTDLVLYVNAYNDRPHSELPKKSNGTHFTPNEYYDFRVAQLMEKMGEDTFHETYPMLCNDELELLYRPEQQRVTRNGWLTLFHENYFAMELVAHHGKEVRVGFDWDNPKDVIVYDMDGRFVAKALLNGNTRPAFDVKSLTEKEAIKRVRGQIKRKQNDIARALADIQGDLIEHRPDFGKWLTEPVPVNDLDFRQPETVEVAEVAEVSELSKKYFGF